MKLVTFVPIAQADIVRNALFAAGCGNIGNYDSCSYNLEGEGTFRAKEGTHPFCGVIGELHWEGEVRIETILPAFKKSEVVRALLSVHPYEEPVFDLYPLQNEWAQAGSGIVGELEEPETEMEFLKRIKKTFEVECLRHNKLTGREIQTVALCGGAGAFLLPQAIRSGADVFITGEIKYHDYFGHEGDILMAEIGLALNLKMPNLNWMSEIVPIKQSVPVAVTLFGGWLMVIALAGIYVMLRNVVSISTYFVLVCAALFVAAGWLHHWLMTRGAKIFEVL